MDEETMMLSEISQSEDKYHPIILLICRIEVTNRQMEKIREREQ